MVWYSGPVVVFYSVIAFIGGFVLGSFIGHTLAYRELQPKEDKDDG